jgi:hypothetical protein
MIAIAGLSTTSPFPFPLFSPPSWAILLFISLAAAGASVVITIIFLDQRKHRSPPSNYFGATARRMTRFK